ncbi:MAG: metal-dependent transcriptional regulator [Trueperaceae bacterium]
MSISQDAHLSTSVGDYLKAIWTVSNSKPASTNAIAEVLGVSSPSVSAMLARLQDSGLIEYERYRGVRLTEQGEREALRLMRRHRLLETFMIEHLGYSWDEVHDEAEVIEHVISDRFTERLAALLDHPTHDPHGDPIPSLDGNLPNTPNTPLTAVDIGAALLLSRLRTQDADVLAYLAKLGIHPGQRVLVLEREPLGGLLHIEIGGRRVVISKELATLVRGEVIE